MSHVQSSEQHRLQVTGRFLTVGGRRLLIKGITYGTFAPDTDGYQFPELSRVIEDFRAMRECGINTADSMTGPCDSQTA